MASYVGIDIGTSTCKFAMRDGKSLHLVVSRMPDNVVDADHQVVSPESLAVFLSSLRKDEHVQERACLLVLAESEVFFRRVSLPPMTADEVLLNLPFEFRDYITGDPSSYTYDYIVDELVKGADGAVTRMDLFAAATAKKLTEQYSSILHKAGFRLRAVIPPQIAYARLLENHILASGAQPPERDKTFILVDIGHSSTLVTLYHGSRYEASKNIYLGCNAFDAAIAELKGIDPYTAGTYKYSNFEGVLDTPECQAICERFCVEIGRVISFYNYSSAEGSIDQMFLMGGGSQIAQLNRAISTYVNVPVRNVSDLLANITANEELAGVCAIAAAGSLESEAM